MPRLIASAPSVEGIKEMIKEYFYLEREVVLLPATFKKGKGEGFYLQAKDGTENKDFRVIKKGTRYRFELVV